MIKKLRLERFKNFRDAELQLGPLTLLIGENATGKSNVGDALRFLCGMGHGYSVAEALGGVSGEGETPAWPGIRGGARASAFDGAGTFALEITFTVPAAPSEAVVTYRVEVDVDGVGGSPRICEEDLRADPTLEALHAELVSPADLQVTWDCNTASPVIAFERWDARRPALAQIAEKSGGRLPPESLVSKTLAVLRSMRFLQLDPAAMRRPSYPGQVVLSDRGDNISAVLHHLCKRSGQKELIASWIEALTPYDVGDITFKVDEAGRILATLVEEGGREISMDSASDGVLRLLGLVVAMLGPEQSSFYFFDDFERVIHPTRLYVLPELAKRLASTSPIQIMATTHSPGLLREFARVSLEGVAMTYRHREQREAHIKSVVDLPDARRVIEKHDIASLHESGWFEDMVAFIDAETEDVPNLETRIGARLERKA